MWCCRALDNHCSLRANRKSQMTHKASVGSWTARPGVARTVAHSLARAMKALNLAPMISVPAGVLKDSCLPPTPGLPPHRRGVTSVASRAPRPLTRV
ncbi:hypothetical protein Hamer_G018455 [Homarus americanus]|uniref:Uncharacterized protein n=1 Tax=Homarus americanus TaxID=6706 RepID=A0A8J5MYN7_HOMAM|nr:hypothetical protein Hamer_G018455 [Homarus americanus]